MMEARLVYLLVKINSYETKYKGNQNLLSVLGTIY